MNKNPKKGPSEKYLTALAPGSAPLAWVCWGRVGLAGLGWIGLDWAGLGWIGLALPSASGILDRGTARPKCPQPWSQCSIRTGLGLLLGKVGLGGVTVGFGSVRLGTLGLQRWVG